MCDVVTAAWVVGGLVVGAAAAQSQAPKSPTLPKQPDPAAERARAEAEAAQRANAQLAMDQRRRRETLLGRGSGSTPGFGETAADELGGSPLSTGGRMTSRSSVARQSSSLMSRGSGEAIVYGGGGGLGGGSNTDGAYRRARV